MNRQKTKLGARVLSEKEMSLILPNWLEIEEQIEVFRNNIEDKDDQTFVQKTNNIGIIGCRGAGKTSVLRTFRLRLSENRNNIVLPIVVPEDMSSSNSLMDVILGMFKQLVDEKKESKECGECIRKGRDSLELSYNEMVKQYCYIKKDYRNILIQQFTTEQYYLDKTKEVFNSDTVFIEKFNEFIKNLVGSGQDSQNPEKKMIFLFIDDIDLSTTRCIEVAKALLSYLSNQRIVTFISGDIDTFEEALTLDFLRQEKALDSTVFHEIYYNTSEKEGELLERKRVLSYEYLKKIIPPAYRYLIKYWSLEDRGNYQIAEGKNLCDLLCDTVGEKVGTEYFSYQDGEERKYLPYTFCMFDETSRGLNNVYNVLSGLTDAGCTDETDQEKRELPEKILLETMIASKILYARYREQLLKQIIVFKEKEVTIHFDNAYNFIYKPIADKERVFQYSAVERFEFFVFIDFAVRIFAPHSMSEESYLKLKNAIVSDFINHEEIEGRIPANSVRNIRLMDEDKDRSWEGSRKLLREFLHKGDFLLDLYLIMYLGRDRIGEIVNPNSNNLKREYMYSIANALAKTIFSMKADMALQKDYIAGLYLIFPEQINELINEISLDSSVIFGETVLGNLTELGRVIKYYNSHAINTADIYFDMTESWITELKRLNNGYWANFYLKKSRFWIYYDWALKTDFCSFALNDIAANLVHKGILKTEMKLMESFFKEHRIEKLSAEEYAGILEKKERKQEQAVIVIDRKDLWEYSYVKTNIKRYLRTQIRLYANYIANNRVVFDISSILKPQGAYAQFKNREASRTGKTLVDKLEKKLEKILFLGKHDNEIQETVCDSYISLEHLMVIQCILKEFLEFHPKAKYGKLEVKRLLMESGEVPVLLKEEEKVWEEIQKKIEDKENCFFNEVFREVSDKLTETEKEEICKIYYSQSSGPILDEMIQEVAGNNITDIEMNLAKYYIQEKKIQSYKNDSNILWQPSEQVVMGKEIKFYLHSYLRYLQANDKNMEEIGAEAEAVAEFVQLALESETLADQKEQNGIFEILSNNMELTEEEFEQLF